MSSPVLIQFGAPTLAALAGGAAGWWLRGLPRKKAGKSPELSQKAVTAQVLQKLQAAADTVRTCVEQHTTCIREIQSELNEPTSAEPVIITKLADSILESNKLAQHQCDDIRKALRDERQEIRDCITSSNGLLFTFASLDRQSQAYRKVLSSLEVLAAELSGEIKWHGQRLKKITGELEQKPGSESTDVAAAVTQILDATADIERRIAKTEKRIVAQAESVEMQAILTHTDLLTSLPNRRALDAELQRSASQSKGGRLATVILVDVDAFSSMNQQYGHQGGDLILRQVAGEIKRFGRPQDMVARFGGDTFAILLNQTTVHDALPHAERIRKQLQDTQFSHGSHSLRVTVSVGVAQLRPEELQVAAMQRAELALGAAQQAGGNLCYRHDGNECVPVSLVFQGGVGRPSESLTLAALWQESAAAEPHAPSSANESGRNDAEADLSGRSLFAATLNRRLSEWKRGGPSVSVAVVRVDQMDELVSRFGEEAEKFLRQVLSRLLEAATRDMDERCEFENGVFALVLPGTDEASAMAVASRLCSQLRQCKVRMGTDLWDLTGSIGMAHCTVAARVMDIMLSAEGALRTAAQGGGDQVCIGGAVAEPRATAAI